MSKQIINNKQIFDSHTHIFPDKIAEKASDGIADFYQMPVFYTGTAADLRKRFSENNICGGLICSVATVVEQVKSINDFIADCVSEHNPVFEGFCSLHPKMSQLELDEEINRAVSRGLKGIKLHPDFQRFKVDGADAYSVYEVIAGRLPVLIHAGDTRFDYSSSKRLSKALLRFPNMTVIAAHLGGWSEWDTASLALAGRENIYVDTSSSLYALTPEKSREYIYAFGEDRVLFGTDYPMWNINEELERFDKLDLSDSAREKILYGNAKKLLGF